ncbi:hypothetical protein NEHOM01_0028 [Nematocida homosporus]|uniref:uncharacterized protein n=1 Tax=Nematocida homosporus TaxID=1912981 RepID=UPI00221F9DD9|nr:uncharacterized protein NEHOM01_0028 [Nematocida homosporus]KAI5184283.1 hypothetical protein NEHOM01_0028 [Nematocida homosporus]
MEGMIMSEKNRKGSDLSENGKEKKKLSKLDEFLLRNQDLMQQSCADSPKVEALTLNIDELVLNSQECLVMAAEGSPDDLEGKEEAPPQVESSESPDQREEHLPDYLQDLLTGLDEEPANNLVEELDGEANAELDESMDGMCAELESEVCVELESKVDEAKVELENEVCVELESEVCVELENEVNEAKVELENEVCVELESEVCVELESEVCVELEEDHKQVLITNQPEGVNKEVDHPEDHTLRPTQEHQTISFITSTSTPTPTPNPTLTSQPATLEVSTEVEQSKPKPKPPTPTFTSAKPTPTITTLKPTNSIETLISPVLNASIRTTPTPITTTATPITTTTPTTTAAPTTITPPITLPPTPHITPLTSQSLNPTISNQKQSFTKAFIVDKKIADTDLKSPLDSISCQSAAPMNTTPKKTSIRKVLAQFGTVVWGLITGLTSKILWTALFSLVGLQMIMMFEKGVTISPNLDMILKNYLTSWPSTLAYQVLTWGVFLISLSYATIFLVNALLVYKPERRYQEDSSSNFILAVSADILNLTTMLPFTLGLIKESIDFGLSFVCPYQAGIYICNILYLCFVMHTGILAYDVIQQQSLAEAQKQGPWEIIVLISRCLRISLMTLIECYLFRVLLDLAIKHCRNPDALTQLGDWLQNKADSLITTVSLILK